ncbi:flavin monoamine oxidase family protein [Algibacter mikhailovii]|uniref:Amine oxidase domain-containing protein n=1 Tax=Algibacter mikhailovii TaxID=425498 RepID=A0A918V8X3_9FLAO|nr:NAD(P)/FAD-dependent oxidoreductase [Algibacter mikhailovii]GGZ81166.1 hypothetical protein GCM10007028_18250 [Algibacter mikhailovii]
MNIIKSDIVIIGAGLTGLTLGHLFKNSRYTINIIEARGRKGGRIHSVCQLKETPIEMGATWLGNSHTYLKTLLEELELHTFKQQFGDKAIYEPTSLAPYQLVTLPKSQDSSYRIKDGTSKLIERLSQSISEDNIYYKQRVSKIVEHQNTLTVETNKNTFKAKWVISTLPPYLLQSTIKTVPPLPIQIQDIMEHTHTWMGESIKVGLRYKVPFWRAPNTSGTIFSNVGPIPEFYDHSNYEDNLFALKGFLNSSYYSLKQEERLKMVLEQLKKYYGDIVNTFISYEEKVWRNDSYTHADYNSHVLPHQNNGHKLYKQPYLNGKFFIAGAETASKFPGYMEGAIRSAYFIFNEIN